MATAPGRYKWHRPVCGWADGLYHWCPAPATPLPSSTGRGSAPGGFNSLDGVASLFSSRGLLLAGWIHYLAFDLWVGRWQVDTRANGPAFGWAVRISAIGCLLMTFLFGPIGLLLFCGLLLSRRIRRSGDLAALPRHGDSIHSSTIAKVPGPENQLANLGRRICAAAPPLFWTGVGMFALSLLTPLLVALDNRTLQGVGV